MEKETSNTRQQWLDIAKGIGIILMVLGHTGGPRFIMNAIYAFHMPLFFIASGWCTSFAKYSVFDFILHKAKSLLLPFTFYSICVLLIKYSLNVEWGGVNAWLCSGWVDYGLWFIPVLFCSLLINKFVFLIESKTLQICCVVAISGIGWYLAQSDCILPWSLSSVPFAVLMVYIGSILKRFIKTEQITTLYIVLGYVLVFAASQRWQLDIAWNKISPVILLTFIAIVGTLSTYGLSYFISKQIKTVGNLLQIIGRETFVVVAFSQIIIVSINQYFCLSPIIKYPIMVVLLTLIALCKNALILSYKKKRLKNHDMLY